VPGCGGSRACGRRARGPRRHRRSGCRSRAARPGSRGGGRRRRPARESRSRSSSSRPLRPRRRRGGCSRRRRHARTRSQPSADACLRDRSGWGCSGAAARHQGPYRPQTNGKAERFIRTLLAGWAYGAIYRSSKERTAALDGWLWYYNHRRRHAALGHQPPVSRTNLLGSYS
jgi:hypothetical protein